MIRHSTWGVLLLLATLMEGCSGDIEKPLTKHGPHSGERVAGKPLPNGDADAAAEIQALIPVAAGIPRMQMERVARGLRLPRFSSFPDKRLSLVALMHKVPVEPLKQTYAEEFRVIGDRTPAPSTLLEEMGRSKHLGCYSMIQADRITHFTCEVDGQTAKGAVSFKAPELYKGRAHYTAEKKDGKWAITTFEMPQRGWRFVRTDTGRWSCFDKFGAADALEGGPRMPDFDDEGVE